MFQGIAKLFGALSSSKTDLLIKQIAEASVASVCERVAEQVDTMSISEARGYIRARAARVVRREARLAFGRFSAEDTELADAVVRGATERLVPIVLRRLSVGVPKAAPLPMAA